MDTLCAKNLMGETPLMHAARISEPVAFVTIANMLPKDQVGYDQKETVQAKGILQGMFV